MTTIKIIKLQHFKLLYKTIYCTIIDEIPKQTFLIMIEIKPKHFECELQDIRHIVIS